MKQSLTSLRNIAPEQLIQWSHVTLKLDGIAIDQGDRSNEREKDQELIVSRTLRFDDTLLDKYADRQDERECRVHGILSFVSELYYSDAV